MNRFRRADLRRIITVARILLQQNTTALELELDDRLAVFLFEECARLDMTPSELVEMMINKHLLDDEDGS